MKRLRTVENPRSEVRNPKQFRNPNSEGLCEIRQPHSDFGTRISFGFRISVFGFLALLSTFTAFYAAQLSTFAQGTAFTYQGRLNDGAAPADGIYDFRFTIYDALSGGSAVAGPLTNSAAAVSNGLFTVIADFGNGAFDGNSRWLETSVRSHGGPAFTILSPRQPITSTPYAILAAGAGTAASLTGDLPANQLSGTLSLAQLPAVLVTNSSFGVTLNGAFSGNGGGLSNLNSAALTGFLTVTSSLPVLSAYPSISAGINPELAISGSYCYIADPGGVIVYDIGNPLALTFVTVLGAGNCSAVRVSGNNLYVGTGAGLKICDLSNPASPQSVGAINNGSVMDVALVGTYCFAADSADGLRIYDVSNPASPTSVGHINSGGSANGVAVSGNYCYVANSADGLRVYDVSAPSTPLAIGHVAETGGNTAWGVSVSGNYCYLGNNSDGLRIYDVSNPAAPVPVAHLTPYAYRAVVVDNLCYLASGTDGLHMYDVSNPAAPVDLGAVPSEVPFGTDLVVTPNFVYMAGAYFLQEFSRNVVTAPAFAGGGGLLTGLNASQLALGTVPDQRLSANVAMLNNADEFSSGVTVDGVTTLQSSANFNGPSDNFAGAADFGSTTRQMLNLWSTHYGIGVQSAVEYFRSDFGFAWYEGGAHNDAEYNSGGGTVLMQLDPGGLFVRGTLVSTSDRALKENFRDVDSLSILDKVAALPVSEWNYVFDKSVNHIGPVAQDFFRAFSVGPDDKHIADIDEGGVALAAIQGLNRKVEVGSQKAEARSQVSEIRIQKLEAENAELRERLGTLERMLHQLHDPGPK